MARINQNNLSESDVKINVYTRLLKMLKVTIQA